MKHLLFITLFFSFMSLLTASGCKKNKLSELDKLPPATQTGANTFGCLVNGKAYLPGGWEVTIQITEYLLMRQIVH